MTDIFFERRKSKTIFWKTSKKWYKMYLKYKTNTKNV